MTTSELVALIKKNPLSAACGVLAVGLAVGIYFRFDAVPRANAELDEKSADARRLALNISHGSHLKEQLDAISAANKVIEGRLMRATDIGINQQFFYKLETDSGVKLIELRQGKRGTATKSGLTPLAFTLSMQGDLTKVLKFVRGLEDGTHYSRVISASCAGARSGLITLTLNIEVLGRP